MQNRMKTHILSEEKTESLLQNAKTASLSTIGNDGMPYVTPIHFVKIGKSLFFHGLPKGEKLDNISRNSKIGLAIYEMKSLLLDEKGAPCDTNTEYESVIIRGNAKIITAQAKKEKVLSAVVAKYTPSLAGQKLPEKMTRGTAVVEIEISKISGKFYD